MKLLIRKGSAGWWVHCERCRADLGWSDNWMDPINYAWPTWAAAMERADKHVTFSHLLAGVR